MLLSLSHVNRKELSSAPQNTPHRTENPCGASCFYQILLFIQLRISA